MYLKDTLKSAMTWASLAKNKQTNQTACFKYFMPSCFIGPQIKEIQLSFFVFKDRF